MVRTKRVRWQALSYFILLISYLILVACGTDVPATTPTATVRPSPAVGDGKSDVRIGFLAPQTGPYKDYGLAIRRGVKLAMEDLKNSGGINGRKIALIERNDTDEQASIQSDFEDLVEKEKVVAVIGTAREEVGLVQTPLANSWRVPMVVSVATNGKLTQSDGKPNYVFRNAVPDNDQAELLADFIGRRNFSRVALVFDTTPAGTTGRQLMTAAFKNRNKSFVFDEKFYPEDKPEDTTAYITRLQTANPDAILYWGLPTNADRLRNALAEKNTAVPFVGPDGFGILSGYLAKPATSTAPTPVPVGIPPGDIYFPQTFQYDNPSPAQLDFINRYRKLANTPTVEYASGLAQSYDAMMMLGLALRQPGAADNRDLLRDALEKVTGLEGLLKIYSTPWRNPTHEALTRSDLTMMVWRNDRLGKAEQGN